MPHLSDHRAGPKGQPRTESELRNVGTRQTAIARIRVYCLQLKMLLVYASTHMSAVVVV